MRVVVDPTIGLRNADPVEHLDGAGARRLLADGVVRPVRLADLVADPVVRVQRRQRVLEDHGDILAAEFAHLIVAETQQVDAVEPDLAADLSARSVVKAEDGG